MVHTRALPPLNHEAILVSPALVEPERKLPRDARQTERTEGGEEERQTPRVIYIATIVQTPLARACMYDGCALTLMKD